MCKHQYYYDDVFPEMCELTGNQCFEEDGCGFEPDEEDVLNGYFEDDPEGYKRWKKERDAEERARKLTEEHEKRKTVVSRSISGNPDKNKKEVK